MTHKRVLKEGEGELGNVAKDGKGCHLVRLEMRWKVVESDSGVTLISISKIGKEQRRLWCALEMKGNEITCFRLNKTKSLRCLLGRKASDF